MLRLWWLVAGIALASQLALAEITLKHDDFSGVTLYYKVITPKDYDPAKEYPAVLAFPGGAQSMPMVDGMIARNLATQAQKRGYIVVVAPRRRRACSTRVGQWCSRRFSTSFSRITRFAGRSSTLRGYRTAG